MRHISLHGLQGTHLSANNFTSTPGGAKNDFRCKQLCNVTRHSSGLMSVCTSRVA